MTHLISQLAITFITQINNKYMSIYSGFATRVLEETYDEIVDSIMYILQKRVLKFYNNQHTDQDKFINSLTKLYTQMKSMETHKYLPPKNSATIQQLVNFLKKKQIKQASVNTIKQGLSEIDTFNESQLGYNNGHQYIKIHSKTKRSENQVIFQKIEEETINKNQEVQVKRKESLWVERENILPSDENNKKFVTNRKNSLMNAKINSTNINLNQKNNMPRTNKKPQTLQQTKSMNKTLHLTPHNAANAKNKKDNSSFESNRNTKMINYFYSHDQEEGQIVKKREKSKNKIRSRNYSNNNHKQQNPLSKPPNRKRNTSFNHHSHKYEGYLNNSNNNIIKMDEDKKQQPIHTDEGGQKRYQSHNVQINDKDINQLIKNYIGKTKRHLNKCSTKRQNDIDGLLAAARDF